MSVNTVRGPPCCARRLHAWHMLCNKSRHVFFKQISVRAHHRAVSSCHPVSGFLTHIPSISSSRDVYERCLSLLHRIDAGGGLFFTMATTYSVQVQWLSLGCRFNNRGFKEGRWNVIQAAVLNERGWCLARSTLDGTWLFCGNEVSVCPSMHFPFCCCQCASLSQHGYLL